MPPAAPAPIDPTTPGTTTTVGPVKAPFDAVSVWSKLIIAAAWSGIFLAAVVVAYFAKSELLGVLLGIAASKSGTIVDYYFGSSAGSAAKDAVNAQLAAPTVQVTQRT